MSLAEFEPAIPATEPLWTYALDRTTIGVHQIWFLVYVKCLSFSDKEVTRDADFTNFKTAVFVCLFVSLAQQPNEGQGCLILEVPRSHTLTRYSQ